MKRDVTMPWLAGVHVVRVGESVSLRVAGSALSQLGASVEQVASVCDVDTSADVVLVDRIAGPVDLIGVKQSSAAKYLDHVSSNNTGVWVTVSAFGLSTTRGDMYASDLTLLASGGILGHSRIGSEFAPTVPPGTLALKLVGHVIAVAALHGLHSVRSGRGPVHADVSGQASVISTGLTLEMAHALANCPDEGGSARYGAPSGFVGCRDGSVYVLVMEEHQWRAFRSVMGSAVETVETLEDARKCPDFVNARLSEWASQRTAQECEQTLQAAGVPCTAVNAITTFAARTAIVGRDFDLDGPDCGVLPAQVREVQKVDGAQAVPPRKLSELRVLDAGHVLAVPLAGAWLGAMGAQVAKLEDPDRLDVYRRRGPFAVGRSGLNRSAYFNQLNYCKNALEHSTARSPEGLDLSAFDVVLENLSPHRAKAIGIDEASVLAQPSPMLLLSSSGFGRTGEWSGYRAYGHNIHAFAGLVDATKDARGQMGDIGTPWADPLTSVVLVTWVLAWGLAGSRSSSLALDISMAELVAAQIAEFATEDAPDPYVTPGSGAQFFVRLPSTGGLLAVTLRDDDDRARFEAIVGATLPQTRGKAPLIDIASPALRDADPDDLLYDLLASGLAAAPVMTSADLNRDAFLRSTGLFRTVSSSELGDYEVTGMPWSFVGEEPVPLTAAPEVG